MFNIRPIEEHDLEFVNETRNASREFLHDNSYFTFTDTVDWFLAKKPRWYIIELPLEEFEKYFTVTEVINNTGKPLMMKLGYFRTKKINSRIMEIGADIHPHFQGKGFGKKAYSEFISNIFELRVENITLEVLANNTRAYSLYRSLGFNVNNESMPIEIIRGRERILSISMELTKEDWNARS